MLLLRVSLVTLLTLVLTACGSDPLVGWSEEAESLGGTSEDAESLGGTSGEDGIGCAPGRPVLAPEVVNARDLGGIPLGEDQAVQCGRLFRGSPLATLSESGCAAVASLGVKTVIDLRVESERLSRPQANCVAESAAIVNAPLPIPFSVSPTDYIADLNTTASVATALRALTVEAAYPAYFHCTYGRDRTGVFAAVVLSILGASREAILEDYLISQTSVGAYPNSLEATLDEIARQGGISAYLSSLGLTGEEVTALRELLTTSR